MMFAKFSGSGVLDPYFEVQEKKKKVVVHFLLTIFIKSPNPHPLAQNTEVKFIKVILEKERSNCSYSSLARFFNENLI